MTFRLARLLLYLAKTELVRGWVGCFSAEVSRAIAGHLTVHLAIFLSSNELRCDMTRSGVYFTRAIPIIDRALNLVIRIDQRRQLIQVVLLVRHFIPHTGLVLLLVAIGSAQIGLRSDLLFAHDEQVIRVSTLITLINSINLVNGNVLHATTRLT